MQKPNIKMSNEFEPKMLPITILDSFKKITELKDVNNSGSDVIIASNTPPKNAPDRLVFLSNKSI